MTIAKGTEPSPITASWEFVEYKVAAVRGDQLGEFGRDVCHRPFCSA